MTEENLPVSWSDIVEQQKRLQQQTAAAVDNKKRFIGFKGGRISINNITQKNTELQVVVLGFQSVREYYKGAYNPDVKALPLCWSLDVQTPHEKAEEKQHENCKECWASQWGSLNKGQACKSKMRVAMLPAEALKDPGSLEFAHIYYASVPATSVTNKENNGFANFLEASNSIHGSITAVHTSMMEVIPHQKTQFQVVFTVGEKIPESLMPLIAPKILEARDGLMWEFSKDEDEDGDTSKQQGKM